MPTLPGIPGLIVFNRPSIGPVQLDCNISEEHNLEAEITSFPIQRGVIASDHIILLPRRLVLTGVITPAATDLTQIIKPRNLHVRGWQALKLLWIAKQLFTVRTSLEIYRNSFVESFTWTRTKETTNSLLLRATLRQLQIVEILFQTAIDPEMADFAQTEDQLNLQGMGEAI